MWEGVLWEVWEGMSWEGGWYNMWKGVEMNRKSGVRGCIISKCERLWKWIERVVWEGVLSASVRGCGMVYGGMTRSVKEYVMNMGVRGYVMSRKATWGQYRFMLELRSPHHFSWRKVTVQRVKIGRRLFVFLILILFAVYHKVSVRLNDRTVSISPCWNSAIRCKWLWRRDRRSYG